MLDVVDSESSQQDNPYIFQINRPILTNDAFNRIAQRAPRSQRSLSTITRSIIKKCKKTTDVICSNRTSSQNNKTSECNISLVLLVIYNWLLSVFPFINVLKKYEPKEWFINDMVAGLTVGIMHVPQGMAYAMLATLPPVYGLYTSFFPPLVYFFFGTSGHISIGTIAVVSLLTGDFLDKVVKEKQTHFDMNHLPEQFLLIDSNSTFGSKNIRINPTAIRIFYAPALSLTAGLTQILMGIVRLGGLTRYFSNPMTSGFTVGVAVHVFTSQIKNVLGITIQRPAGLFSLPLTYVEIFKNFRSANIPTVVLSSVCITILAVYKDWLNPRIVKYTMVPIPMDLIIVILCTVASHFLELNEKYHVKIVGQVNKGIEPPELPHLSEMGNYIGDILVVAIVAFSVSISLSQIFGNRFNYRIDTNQELIAYGLANTIGSFFHTFPTAASLSRSAVQVSAGGRTQIATLFSSGLLIMVLCFIGPLFYSVPNCCLASIILVALKSMFMQAVDLKYLWNYSLWDSSVWLVTLTCTIFLNVSYGLLVGIVYSALCTILRTQSPTVRVLGQSDHTEIYSDPKHYQNCFEHPNIKIVRYEGNLYYACGGHFRQSIYLKSGVNPSELNLKRIKMMRKVEEIEKQLGHFNSNHLRDIDAHPLQVCNSNYQEIKVLENGQVDGNMTRIDDGSIYINMELPQITSDSRQKRYSCTVQDCKTSKCRKLETEEALKRKLIAYNERLDKLNQSQTLKYLILDCSFWTFIDVTGADELKQLIQNYHKVGIHIMLAGLKDELVNILTENQKLDQVELFLTVHDAVLAATRKINQSSQTRTDDVPEPNGPSASVRISVNLDNPEENTTNSNMNKWLRRSSSVSDNESRI